MSMCPRMPVSSILAIACGLERLLAYADGAGKEGRDRRPEDDREASSVCCPLCIWCEGQHSPKLAFQVLEGTRAYATADWPVATLQQWLDRTRRRLEPCLVTALEGRIKRHQDDLAASSLPEAPEVARSRLEKLPSKRLRRNLTFWRTVLRVGDQRLPHLFACPCWWHLPQLSAGAGGRAGGSEGGGAAAAAAACFPYRKPICDVHDSTHQFGTTGLVVDEACIAHPATLEAKWRLPQCRTCGDAILSTREELICERCVFQSAPFLSSLSSLPSGSSGSSGSGPEAYFGAAAEFLFAEPDGLSWVDRLTHHWNSRERVLRCGNCASSIRSIQEPGEIPVDVLRLYVTSRGLVRCEECRVRLALLEHAAAPPPCATCDEGSVCMNYSEFEFYSLNGFSPPKRCQKCRAMGQKVTDGQGKKWGSGGGSGGGGAGAGAGYDEEKEDQSLWDTEAAADNDDYDYDDAYRDFHDHNEPDEDATWLSCYDCYADFAINAGETEFYFRQGFPLPKRCKDCRAARALSAGP